MTHVTFETLYVQTVCFCTLRDARQDIVTDSDGVSHTADREIVQDVVEKLCYIGLGYDTELKTDC